MTEFRERNTFDARRQVAAAIREAHPDRYPVIVELDPQATLQLHISKHKFLAPGDIPLNRFMLEVRKVILMDRQAPLAVMVESGHMITADATMAALWERFHHADGFLYILFSGDA
jgi:hypothetical protein